MLCSSEAALGKIFMQKKKSCVLYQAKSQLGCGTENPVKLPLHAPPVRYKEVLKNLCRTSSHYLSSA